MSYNYQLFNQNFISSELYYLPINSGIGKILSCGDLLGQFQWSNLSSIAVTSIQSDNNNILINNLFNNPQYGDVTIHLNNDLNLNQIQLNSLYADNLYEKTNGNKIILNNDLKLTSNNTINLGDNTNKFSNIYAGSYYGEIKTNSQPYITVLSNLIQAGNLNNLNSNNIQPTTSNLISLGTSINKFNSLFLSSTVFSLTANSTNLYITNIFERVASSNIQIRNQTDLNNNNLLNCNDFYSNKIYTDGLYEKTLNNKIKIYNNLILQDTNIEFKTDNACFIGTVTNKLNNIHTHNINITNIIGNNADILITANLLPQNTNTHTIGSISYKFSNSYFINSNITNLYTDNQYLDGLYEKTLNNKIKIFNNLILQDVNIEFKSDNASFIGNVTNKLNNIHTHNINITNIIGNNADILITANLLPQNTNTHTIGSISYKFSNSYFINSNITNLYTDNQYVDNLYEKTVANNIRINNNVDMKNNDIKDVKNIYLDEIHSASLNDIEIKSNIDMNNKYITGINYINFGQSNLNYYEEGQIILNYSRGFTGTVVVDYIKIGKIVTLMFQSDSISRNVTSDYVLISTIPAFLRPRFTIFKSAVYGSNNNTGSVLSMAIESNGNIIIGNSLTNIFAFFTAGTVVAGFYAFDITYFTN